MTTIDMLKAVACCVVLILVTLTWLHWSRQRIVARTIRASVAVVIRIIVAHLILIPVICIGGRCPFDYLAIAIFVILLLSPIASLEIADNWLVTIAVLPSYVLKQFILGFPDRRKVVLSPEPTVGKSSVNPATARADKPTTTNNSTIATVVSSLNPFGYVELGGERVAAVSLDGSLIDQGTTVQICDQRNRTLVVRLIE